ncbi:hypothetical protein N7519_002485 [Penicillium mononematosum]|uniref:uncharacterized protein n=1 Tax=Penicillium mononematosum TaxID=268346 RepID=UPI002548065F|nr:uncharacterized protein N7519_002485 [Penicillium mononematosum]KAJ6187577.1 hypothetical protein N7519_002485 [Penicillium mononematosum]
MSAPTGIPTYNSAPVNPNKEGEGTHATASQPEPATAIEPPASAPSQPPAAPATTTAAATAPSNPAIYTTAEPKSAPQQQPQQPPPRQRHPQRKLHPLPNPAPSRHHQQHTRGRHPKPLQSPPPPKAGEAISQPPTQPTQSYTQFYSYNPPLGAQTALPNSTTSSYSSVYPTQAGSHRPQALPLHYGAGAGAGSGGGASSIFPEEEEEEGFMGAAKGWLRWSGNKLAEVEKGVWKKINDVHD